MNGRTDIRDRNESFCGSASWPILALYLGLGLVLKLSKSEPISSSFSPMPSAGGLQGEHESARGGKEQLERVKR